MKIYILLCLKLMNIFNILVNIQEGKKAITILAKENKKILSPLSKDEIDQLLKFHVTAKANVDDRVVIFDNIKECFLFKNELGYEFEEHELERDSM